MQENQISHVFWTFLLLTEEDMASCSWAFRKAKSAVEERNLICIEQLFYLFCAKVNLLCAKLVETTLNMHPPFVVSGACWLINYYS